MFYQLIRIELVQPLQSRGMDTRLIMIVYAILLAALAGCGGSDELSNRVPNGFSSTSDVLDDGVSRVGPAFTARQELRGVSADAENAVVRVSWALTDDGMAVLRPNSRIRLRTFEDDIPGRVIETRAVNEDAPSGTFDMPVNTETDTETSWYLELDRADLTAVPGITGSSVLNLGDILRRNTTPLNDLRSIDIELLPDSYTAETMGNRREHNFSVNVKGLLEFDPDQFDSVEERITKEISVTGLLTAERQPFVLTEDGVDDGESPLTVTDQRKDPLVYLVMDASSSMQESECSDDLYHAVNSTVITLAPVANFNYRIFDNEVFEVDSTLEFLPIDGVASGSALYFALDTVVADILRWENRDRDIYIIAYSDGLDLASWNHYDFDSRDAVVTHVGRRLGALAQEHADTNGRELKTFLVGFDPMTGSEAEEMLYLATQGRGEYIQMSRDDCNSSLALQNSAGDVVGERIKETFQTLTNQIRSVYHFNYSSQQTHGKSVLQLTLDLTDSSEVSDWVADSEILPPRPVD